MLDALPDRHVVDAFLREGALNEGIEVVCGGRLADVFPAKGLNLVDHVTV